MLPAARRRPAGSAARRRPPAPAARRRPTGARRRRRRPPATRPPLPRRAAPSSPAFLGRGALRLLLPLELAPFLDGLLAGAFRHRLRIPPSHSPPRSAG